MHYLYYARLTAHNGDVLYKLGISKNPATRYSRLRKRLNFRIIITEQCKNEGNARAREKYLLNKHAVDRSPRRVLPSGYTEIFSRDILRLENGKYSFDAQRNHNIHPDDTPTIHVKFNKPNNKF